MEELKKELENYALSQGITLMGVADITPIHDLISKRGGTYLAGFPRAISLVMRLSDSVVDPIGLSENDQERRMTYFTYREHVDAVRLTLNQVSLSVIRKIEEAGYRAYPLCRGETDQRTLSSVMSEKVAPHLAGLGWIGKNTLLVTQEFGPRGRLTTILTDAPLSTGRPGPNRCERCEECVEACPAGAFTGASFDPTKPREALFNPYACREYCNQQLTRLEVKGPVISTYVCGLCMNACPLGQRNARR